MNKKGMISIFMTAFGIFLLSSCATIVNDANIPVNFVFEDGSKGECDFSNKRGYWSCDMPCDGVMIRRSDDDLEYDCKTDEGKQLNGFVKSHTEGGKMAASVIFWDLGITDAITDKHRRYQANVIIPVKEGEKMLISDKGTTKFDEQAKKEKVEKKDQNGYGASVN